MGSGRINMFSRLDSEGILVVLTSESKLVFGGPYKEV